MPHTRHRKKTLRKNQEQRLKNRAQRTNMRGTVKAAKAAIADDPANVDGIMSEAVRKIDKAAKANLIHPNKASRMQSRMAKARNKAQADS